MRKTAGILLIVFCLSAALLQAAVIPHIGFVYPAGGRPGATLSVTIGGQYLKDFVGIHLSGISVIAQKTDYLRIYEKREAGGLRRTQEKIEALLAEEKDATIRQQLQRQLEFIDQEMAMVNEMRREEKKDPAMAKKKQFNPQIAERVTLDLALPENVAPGDYELRVVTTNGLSNPILFQIGQLPETSEDEPNDAVTKPEILSSLPVLVNGQVMPGDVDCFRFPAAKGQTLVFKADARLLIPYLADAVPGWFQAVLTLYDTKGREIVSNDDYQGNPDPVLIYKVPEDGDYILSIRDSIFRGREDFVYRLSMGEIPFIERIEPLGGPIDSTVNVRLYGVNLPDDRMRLSTGHRAPEMQPVQVQKDGFVSNRRLFSVSSLPDSKENEPNDRFTQACAVPHALVINGKMNAPGDQDWFSIAGAQGQALTAEVHARRLGSPMDARLMLLDAQQHVLAVSDDVEDKSIGLATHHADPRIDFTLPEKGTYYIRLDDVQGKGGADFSYRLTLAQEQPDFRLRIIPSSLRIPKDGSAVATVHALRSGGFNGEITLSLAGSTGGIEILRNVIPAGADKAKIVIAATPQATTGLMPLEFTGMAQCGGQTVRRRVVPAEDMMQAFLYRHLVPAQELLIQITQPEPVTVTLTPPEGELYRVRPGSQIVLHSQVKWRDASRRGIRLTLTDPPEWLTLKTANIAARGGDIILDVNPNAEPGESATVLLNGTARIPKDPSSPDFNPIAKWQNNTVIDFSIDAVSVMITE